MNHLPLPWSRNKWMTRTRAAVWRLMRPASWESLDNVSLTRPAANHTEPRILDISVYIWNNMLCAGVWSSVCMPGIAPVTIHTLPRDTCRLHILLLCGHCLSWELIHICSLPQLISSICVCSNVILLYDFWGHHQHFVSRIVLFHSS